MLLFLPLDKNVEKSSQSLYRDEKLPLALICIRSLKADLWFRFYSDLPVVFPCVSCLWWQAVCFEMLRYLVTCHAWQTWHGPSDIRWGNPEHAKCFNCDKLRELWPGLWLTLPGVTHSWHLMMTEMILPQLPVGVSNLLQIFTSSCVHSRAQGERDSGVLRLHRGQNNGKYNSPDLSR